MVISHKHKYLFIEVYRTGSTAISSELCELYDVEKILSKHSRYHEFLKIASEEEKQYYVFSGIRNPMDMVVSGYLKMKTDHKGRYTNHKELAEVLLRLNIEQKRELPHKNKTEQKENFLDYYTPEIRKRSLFIFGPFIEKWGYSFPEEW